MKNFEATCIWITSFWETFVLNRDNLWFYRCRCLPLSVYTFSQHDNFRWKIFRYCCRRTVQITEAEFSHGCDDIFCSSDDHSVLTVLSYSNSIWFLWNLSVGASSEVLNHRCLHSFHSCCLKIFIITSETYLELFICLAIDAFHYAIPALFTLI